MTTSLIHLLIASACVAVSCSSPAPRPTPGHAKTPRNASPTSTATAGAAPALSISTGGSATPPPAAPPPRPTPAPVAQVLKFQQLREHSVKSLALGKKGHAAVLADEPWQYDGVTWKEHAVPTGLRGPTGSTDEIEIYFGRDNRIRLMGTRQTGDEQTFVYLRYKHGWRKGHREIGALANKPQSGLFGILGWDDPEVVCRIGGICIIKRLTGWTVIQSGPGAPAVVIAQESAWALHSDHIAEVSNSGWRRLDAIPFQNPRGLWADANKKLWVSAGEELHHHDGSAWKKHDSPVKSPRAVWGSGANDVWVAGDDGAGHYNGVSWRKVAGVEGPLTHVLGRDDEVWLAGVSGVWRGKGKR